VSEGLLERLARSRNTIVSTSFAARGRSRAVGYGGQLALALCTACAEYGEDPANSRQSLLNAEPSGPEDDAVVQLVSVHESGPHRCTGTLIAANLVLTARHCVANHVLGDFDCDPNGDLVSRTGGMMGSVIAP